MTTIIDKRNESGSSIPNREKFMRRYREQIKDSLKRSVKDIDIRDVNAKNIDVEVDDIELDDPSFVYKSGSGTVDRVLPGNKKYNRGSRVSKPQSQGGNGATQGGDGRDPNTLTIRLSREEFLDAFFSDLRLPDLIKKTKTKKDMENYVKTGTTKYGPRHLLNVKKTMSNVLGRHLIEEKRIEDAAKKLPKNKRKEYIETEKSKIPYIIDDVDLRYFTIQNKPEDKEKAVMFCLMDVSGSMEAEERDIARRLFMLVYLFLTINYKDVDIRFICHTTTAKEVNEKEFFENIVTGGTMISSGVQEILDIIESDYNLSEWNIYVTQASDGDNWSLDNKKTLDLLRSLIPMTQYYIYASVACNSLQFFGAIHYRDDDNIKSVYSKLVEEFTNLAVVKLPSADKVYSIFRKLFAENKDE